MHNPFDLFVEKMLFHIVETLFFFHHLALNYNLFM